MKNYILQCIEKVAAALVAFPIKFVKKTNDVLCHPVRNFQAITTEIALFLDSFASHVLATARNDLRESGKNLQILIWPLVVLIEKLLNLCESCIGKIFQFLRHCWREIIQISGVCKSMLLREICTWTCVVKVFHGVVNIVISPYVLLKKLVKYIGNTLVQWGQQISLAIHKVVSSIRDWFLGGLRSIKDCVVKVFHGVVSIVISPYVLLKKLVKYIENTLVQWGQQILLAIKQIPSIIAMQLHLCRNQVIGICMKPVTILALVFAITAFFGLRVYDNQISKIEYSRGRFAAKRTKNLLMRKRYALHGYGNENISHEKKSHRRHFTSTQVPAQNSPKEAQQNGTDFQKTVDDFLRRHEISDIMCEQGFCRIKIDNKVVDSYSSLAEDFEIFIADSDGECVTFADLAGHTCSKSIESFLKK
ncbi:MAG: hypothetical protein LBI81_01420 [Puniceicoccales bacterium]|jgi:hypothetical protein|nr:hypothetical protein [Puniceicoccales bacterium]